MGSAVEAEMSNIGNSDIRHVSRKVQRGSGRTLEMRKIRVTSQ